MLKIFIVKDTKDKQNITKYYKIFTKYYSLYIVNKHRRNLKAINLNIELT